MLHKIFRSQKSHGHEHSSGKIPMKNKTDIGTNKQIVRSMIPLKMQIRNVLLFLLIYFIKKNQGMSEDLLTKLFTYACVKVHPKVLVFLTIHHGNFGETS